MNTDRRTQASIARISPHEADTQHSTLRSAITWAVLGLVIAKPDHGYALKDRFEDQYHGLLELRDPSSVYRSLDALEERGWVEALPDPSTRGVRKICFRVTEAGKEAFEDHLVEEMARYLDDGQMFFCKLALVGTCPEGALALIARAERLCASKQGRVLPAPTAASTHEQAHAFAERLCAQGRRLVLSAASTVLRHARSSIEADASEAQVK
ncbi:MAG TPA: PadR family transcriptional regulator [Solirubrobacteraceae bacterium]|nr:PadR family transcriptional regulator [Solirubrobacteraceae bacterium]